MLPKCLQDFIYLKTTHVEWFVAKNSLRPLLIALYHLFVDLHEICRGGKKYIFSSIKEN